jgi:ATP-dependent exoDNAse (exonuclease V) beta subunit
MVGIICPEARHDELEAVMRAANIRWGKSKQDGLAAGINLMTPDTSKGLEFDAAVVAFPDEIIGDEPIVGGRLLYIAMTRCTQELSIVFSSDPLGGALGTGSSDSSPIDLTDTDGGLWAPPVHQLGLDLPASAPTAAADLPSPEEEPAEISATSPAEPTRSSRVVRLLVEEVAQDVGTALHPDQVETFLEALRQRLLGARDAEGENSDK